MSCRTPVHGHTPWYPPTWASSPFRYILRTLLCVVLFLCHATNVSAQSTDRDTLRLTIRDAVLYSVNHNHDLAAAWLEVRRADEMVNEAWGTILPNINVQGTYTRTLKKPVFFLPDFSNLSSGKITPIEIGATHSMDMGFRASQILFNSAVFVGVGTASTYALAARDVYAAQELATITNARKAFYNVLVAHAVLGLMRQNLAYAEENLRTVRLLAEQGLVAEYDLLRSQVSVSNLTPEVIQAENGYTLSLSSLKISLGIPFDKPAAVNDSLFFEIVQDSLMENAVSMTVRDNPALSALRRQTEVNDAIVSVERSAYLPTLAAFGNYQLVSQNNGFKFSTNDFIGSSQVGITLSMNIFNGFQTNARVERATLEFRKSQEQLTSNELAMQTSAEATVGRLRRAALRIAAQKQTVEQAERGYKIATTRYNSGAGTLLEVNDARLALTTAKVNRIQALYDYVVASAELDQMLGRVPAYLPRAEE